MNDEKRIVLKLSGEALGQDGKLFDFAAIQRVARVIAALRRDGREIAIILGGGNIWRGRTGPAAGMDPVNADNMGMLATAINCIAMADALDSEGVDARVMSAVPLSRFAENYTVQAANDHLFQGRVILSACGIGNPFLSTDTTAAMRAIELKADAIWLAKNVDGVYTADPKKDPNARLLPALTYQTALSQNLQVMDLSAFALCAQYEVPVIRVFSLKEPENILKIARGDAMGSIVTA